MLKLPKIKQNELKIGPNSRNSTKKCLTHLIFGLTQNLGQVLACTCRKIKQKKNPCFNTIKQSSTVLVAPKAIAAVRAYALLWSHILAFGPPITTFAPADIWNSIFSITPANLVAPILSHNIVFGDCGRVHTFARAGVTLAMRFAPWTIGDGSLITSIDRHLDICID